ncbi:MFS transporter [Chitinophaga sp. Cy-1792]|uniref:MFS transporter n=1 Tax=Chitinophaga sp. Cy-1792 TaxID=2608339 RepID=UPI00141EDC57|nr:MFS transporter [Chitinophaga sp. Cy-1792]NIG54678.1 MFS transporter [Chitinophaga sp. Cy-1792]
MAKANNLHILSVLKNRNYMLYIGGKTISQLGTWMQRTAVVWLVYSITHSSALLGVTVFVETFPSFLLSIVGGVAADRWNRYKIIQITQIASMIQSVILALMVFLGHPIIWLILALSVLLGIINAFDIPARQTLLNDVVTDKNDLPSAISFSAATASIAQLLGPALSGIVLNAFGASVCFISNAATFIAVIISLHFMDLPTYVPKKSDKKVLGDFAEGFKYIIANPNIGMIILRMALISLLVLPFSTLLPVFAKVIFKGDASTYGYINSVIGIGAVICTVFLTTRRPDADMKKLLFVSTLLLGAGLIVFSQLNSFPVAIPFILLAGIGTVSQFNISNIIVQSEAAPEFRGRSISIFLMAAFGMMPIGSLLIGMVSEHTGAPATVLAAGIFAFIIALAFAWISVKKLKKATTEDMVESI